MIGLRASWTCSLCDVTATTHHLEMAGRRILLDPPARWRLIPGGSVYCPDHSRAGEQIAEAERASGASGLYGRKDAA